MSILIKKVLLWVSVVNFELVTADLVIAMFLKVFYWKIIWFRRFDYLVLRIMQPVDIAVMCKIFHKIIFYIIQDSKTLLVPSRDILTKAPCKVAEIFCTRFQKWLQ